MRGSTRNLPNVFRNLRQNIDINCDVNNLQLLNRNIKKFKPKKAILSNLSPVLDYNQLKKVIPKNVIPAHDGLTVEL